MKNEDKKIRKKTRGWDFFETLKILKLEMGKKIKILIFPHSPNLMSQKFKDERREEDFERDEALSGALLSEEALAKDWDNELDKAWNDL